jgi:hypothetical protein
MSDYTPSTDQVREGYAYTSRGNGEDRVLHFETFDRWLAKHDAEVAATALEEFARKAQQDAVDQLGMIGFARVPLDLLHAAAAEYREKGTL